MRRLATQVAAIALLLCAAGAAATQDLNIPRPAPELELELATEPFRVAAAEISVNNTRRGAVSCSALPRNVNSIRSQPVSSFKIIAFSCRSVRGGDVANTLKCDARLSRSDFVDVARGENATGRRV